MKKLYTLLFVLTLAAEALAQTASLSGTIQTQGNQAIELATVQIKELDKKAITGQNGNYEFNNLPAGTYTVTASYIGYVRKQQTVTLTEGESKSLAFILEAATNTLDDVTVSSYRSVNSRNLNVGKAGIRSLDLPQSLTVVGQDVIAQQQSLKLSDVVKNINGVYLGTTRGSTQESFYARGYSFSSNNTFKNGSRINPGAMPEVSSLERVEVLKGSAAILYGNVAPGGIMNLVTKQPKFEHGGRVNMTIGSYDEYKPVVDVYGPISDKVAYRFNGNYENGRSFRNQVASERYYVNPSLLFKAGSKTDILVQGDYLDHRFTPDFGTGIINNRIAGTPRSLFLGAAWSNAHTRQATASTVVTHRFNSSWELNSTLAYQFYKRDFQSTERIQPLSNGDWNRPLGKNKNLENYFAGQVNMLGKFTTGSIGHRLMTGIDADRYNSTSYTYIVSNRYLDQNNNQVSSTYDVINILDPSKYQARTDMPVMNPFNSVVSPTNRYGIYAQDLLSIGEKVKVLAGLRWSYQLAFRTRTTQENTVGSTLAGTLTHSAAPRRDQAFSPRAGMVYQPTKKTSLFVSYANSFTTNTGTDVNKNPMEPSIINQYEAGVKNEFFDGKLSANVTVYRIDNSNLAQMAVFQADGVTPNTDSNVKEFAGQTKSDGFEFDLAGQPAKGLDIIAGYSYNFMRFTRTNGKAGSNLAGERVVNTPAHTANASVFYTFNGGRLNGLKLGATALYIGKRIGGWNNTTGFSFGSTGLNTRQIPLDGFTTIDLTAGYAIGRFNLLAKLSNVSNTLNYYVHENYSVNPIAPRQVITTLSYKF